MLEIMKIAFASGKDVMINSFGKFQVRQKTERCGKNPAIDAGMMLAPRHVVTFRCSMKLRGNFTHKNRIWLSGLLKLVTTQNVIYCFWSKTFCINLSQVASQNK
jgi:nucleoid DNA-binding protein